MTEQPVEETPDHESKLKWVTVDEVHLDWLEGEPPMADESIAFQLWRAENKILSEFPDIESWVASGQVRASTVAQVALGVAMRRLTNPRYQRSVQQGAGPYQSMVTTGGDHPGEIYLSEADRAALRPRRKPGRRAFSMMPRF